MDVLQTVVGGKECPIETIHSIIQTGTVLTEKWSQFARGLGIANAKIKKLRQDMQLDKITYSDLIFEVLEAWVGQSGSKATLGALLQIVEGEYGENGVGESLRLRFNLQFKVSDRNSPVEWKELSPAFQTRVTQNLQSHFPDLEFAENHLRKLNGPVLGTLATGNKPPLFKQTLPKRLSYYISRTLVPRNIISNNIFEDDDIKDVFLITGMDRLELSELVKNKLTSTSKELLCSEVVTSFVILEKMSHFERICEKTNKRVHLLNKEADGRFRWIRSNKDFVSLQRYVDKSQNALDEDTFCRTLDPHTMFVFISDSPGHMLAKTYPDRIVVFIALNEFIKVYKPLVTADKHVAIEKALQTIICENAVGEAVLKSKLNSEEGISIELLLDGFDEVDSTEHKSIYEIFQTIQSSFKSVRLWITSRPHFLTHLENSFSQFGYNIRAFCEDDQIEFLSSFWSRNSQLHLDKSKKFAQYCLKSLKSQMTSKDDDIAGIPLQCLLIGEVYEVDALEYARLESELQLEIEIGTITNLYQSLINRKLEKYQLIFAKGKSCSRKIIEMHVSLSLDLLFPETIKKLKRSLVSVVFEEVLKFGLLESSSTAKYPRFMHRTFAEYFVSWFVIDMLSKKPSRSYIWQISTKSHILDFFFEHALGCQTETVTTAYSGRYPSYKFRYPVISYFINSLLADLKIKQFLVQSSEQRSEKLAHACVNADHVHIFNFLDGLDWFEKYAAIFAYSELLLVSIENSGLELIRLIFIHSEKHFEIDITVQEAILRSAVARGMFSIVEYLIKEKQLRRTVEEPDDSIIELLHDCVKAPWNKSKVSVEQRRQVMNLLVGINKSLLEAKDSKGKTPLLSKSRCVQSLIELIQLGADVMAQDKDNNTVLHLNSDRGHLSSADYQALVMSIPIEKLRKLVHAKGSYGKTPLITIFEWINPLPETLELFKSLDANFNAFNNFDNSVLAIAIRNGADADEVRRLVKLGAKIKWRKQQTRESLLHYAAMWGKVEIIALLVDEMGVEVNIRDSEGLTPLDYAIKSIQPASFVKGVALHERQGTFKDVVNLEGQSWLHVIVEKGQVETVRLLVHLGVNVNAIDNHGNTPLHLAISRIHDEKEGSSIVQFLMDSGANPNAVNKYGTSAFQVVIQNGHIKTFELLKSKSHLEWTPAFATFSENFLLLRVESFTTTDFFSLFIAQQRLDQGFDINLRDAGGTSILHYGAKRGDNSTLTFLLEAGANINLTNNKHQTPLHFGALVENKNDSFNVIKFLIEEGADAHAKDEKNRTFLHIYITSFFYSLSPSPSPSQLYSMVEYLVRRNFSSIFNMSGCGCPAAGAEYFEATPLHLVMRYLEPDEKTLSLLYSNRVDFDTVDSDGNSVLGNAVMGGRSTKILSVLVNQFEANPSHLNNEQESVLHFAARESTTEALDFFLNLKVLDVNGKAKNGDTPLHSALQWSRINIMEKCKLLISSGADVNISNGKGRTPLEISMEDYEGTEKLALNRLLSNGDIQLYEEL